MVSAVRGNDSTEILMVVFSASSPEPPTLQFPHTALVYSVLPLRAPKVSGCKINFVPWPFNTVPAFLAISPCLTEILLLFTASYYMGLFPGSGALDWGARFEV